MHTALFQHGDLIRCRTDTFQVAAWQADTHGPGEEEEEKKKSGAHLLD